MEKIEVSQVTPEVIEQWKKKFDNIFKLNIEDKVCYLKQPSRKDLGYASSIKDPIKYNETLLKACWLAGDEIILTDDNYFLTASNKLSEIIQLKEAELVKL